MLLTASIFALIGYGISKQEGEKSRNSDTVIADSYLDKINDRQSLLFDMGSRWNDMKEMGNWAWQTPMYKPPVTTLWQVYSPPKNAELVDWDQPMNWFMKTDEKRRNFRENYRDAYSTETEIGRAHV